MFRDKQPDFLHSALKSKLFLGMSRSGFGIN